MVLANPHFPWRGTERFWMAQLDVPGQYDVEGGTLEGIPLIGIGFNQHLAWTHTVANDFRFTFYQLSLVPGDPTSYYVDGQSHKMKHGDGAGRYRSRYEEPHLLHDAGGGFWSSAGGLPLDFNHGLRRGRLHSQRPGPGGEPVPMMGESHVREQTIDRGIEVFGHPIV